MHRFLEGNRVKGIYLGDIPVTGTVTESRISSDGSMRHTVRLDEPLIIYGTFRKNIILEADRDVFAVIQ